MAKKVRNIYAEVTDKIIAQLDAGVVPWSRPWASSGFPLNLKSDAPYRGINTLLLAMAAEDKSYTSPYWTTYAQAQAAAGYEYKPEVKRSVYKFAPGMMACPDLGKDEDGKTIRGEAFEILGVHRAEDGLRLVSGSNTLTSSDCRIWRPDEYTHPKYGVRKGEKGTSIIFWKPTDVVDRDEGGHTMVRDGEVVMRKSFILRTYSVFNIEQCKLPDSVTGPITPEPRMITDEERADEGLRFADNAVTSYLGDLGGPAMNHGGQRACYAPAADIVSMPTADTFISEAAYVATLFHELAHSTGHRSRLDRLDVTTFGTETYAKEELVAELAASMMLGTCGILHDRELQNSASYIDGWRKKISEEPNLVVMAAAQAQKACDHMLGITFGEDGESA